MELEPLRRVNYFYGKLMTVDDFKDEQRYVVNKNRLHNRFLHGVGVVEGLEVTEDDAKRRVTISPGYALDCRGREIIVSQPVEVALPAAPADVYLCIRYAERGVEPIPAPGEPSHTEPRLIEEGFEFVFEFPNPLKGHRRHLRLRCACGKDHAIPLKHLRLRRTRRKTKG